MFTSFHLACFVYGALILAGLGVIWRQVIRSDGRARWSPVLLPRWDVRASDILLLLLLAVAGSIAGVITAGFFIRRSTLDATAILVVLQLAFQGGLLLGLAIFHFAVSPIDAKLPSAPGRTLWNGVLTFLIAVPVAQGIGLAWQFLLGVAGFDVKRQLSIELFERLHSPWLKIVFALLAVVVAPITEECIFRAGIFRFLRGRISSSWAIVVSSVLFGAGHLIGGAAEGLGSFLPLVALGIVLAVAYERTGRIGVPMVAHSLFNLAALFFVLTGLDAHGP
jgi:uncharacterized protein